MKPRSNDGYKAANQAARGANAAREVGRANYVKNHTVELEDGTNATSTFPHNEATKEENRIEEVKATKGCFNASGEDTYQLVYSWNDGRGILSIRLNTCLDFNSSAGCARKSCDYYHSDILGLVWTKLPQAKPQIIGACSSDVRNNAAMHPLLFWTEDDTNKITALHQANLRSIREVHAHACAARKRRAEQAREAKGTSASSSTSIEDEQAAGNADLEPGMDGDEHGETIIVADDDDEVGHESEAEGKANGMD